MNQGVYGTCYSHGKFWGSYCSLCFSINPGATESMLCKHGVGSGSFCSTCWSEWYKPEQPEQPKYSLLPGEKPSWKWVAVLGALHVISWLNKK